MAYSRVERSTWDDEKFRAWPRDVRDTWLYLLTCRHQGRLGMFVLDPMFVAADVQIPLDSARAALEQLAAEGRILRDPPTRLVLILRHLKHNPIENPNVATAALRELLAIPFAEPLWEGLREAVVRWCPMKTAKGEPFCEPIVDAICKRLKEARLNGSGNGSGNGMPKGTSWGGLGNPDPEPDPLPEPTDEKTGRSTRVESPQLIVENSESGNGEARAETPNQEVMGGLRKLGYELDGDAGRTNGSIVKRWLSAGSSPGEILMAAEGFSWICRRWALEGKWEGPPSLKPLHSKKLNQNNERTPLWTEAMVEYNNRHKRDRMPSKFGGLLSGILGESA